MSNDTTKRPLNRWGDHTEHYYLTPAGMAKLVCTLRSLHDHEFDGINEAFIRDTAGFFADLLSANVTWRDPMGGLQVSWDDAAKRRAYELLHVYVGGLKQMHDDLLPEGHAPMLTTESIADAMRRTGLVEQTVAKESVAAS